MKLHEFRPKHVVESWSKINDGTRTLLESVLFPEVVEALKAWMRAGVGNCVLIGGLALSFRGRPRTTDDADFLFLNQGLIPDSVPGFKKTGPHAFRHDVTHVEIEVLDPEYLGFPPRLVEQIMATAEQVEGLLVASKEGLIASKLKRFSRQDQADIEHLILAGADLSSWDLPADLRQKYEEIRTSI